MPTVGGNYLSPDINTIKLAGDYTVPATGTATHVIGHVPIGTKLIDAVLAQKTVGVGTTGGSVTVRANEGTPLNSTQLGTLQTFSRQVPDAATEYFTTTEDTDIVLVVVAGAGTWTTQPVVRYNVELQYPGHKTV